VRATFCRFAFRGAKIRVDLICVTLIIAVRFHSKILRPREVIMSIKATAATLIVTALALVGDYSAAQSHAGAAAPHESFYKHPKVRDLRSTISGLTRGWLELDLIYSEAVKAAYTANVFDDERFLRNIELLSAVRTLEASLKSAAVPNELMADHLGLRRAIAKTRSRLAMLDNFYKQFFAAYEEFETAASPQALKYLADHTTKRLGVIA
jgi:hypothetical protein